MLKTDIFQTIDCARLHRLDESSHRCILDFTGLLSTHNAIERGDSLVPIRQVKRLQVLRGEELRECVDRLITQTHVREAKYF